MCGMTDYTNLKLELYKYYEAKHPASRFFVLECLGIVKCSKHSICNTYKILYQGKISSIALVPSVAASLRGPL